MALASGGESDLPACGPSASFSVNPASGAVTPMVSCTRGDNVGEVKEMMCVVYVSVTEVGCAQYFVIASCG